MGGNGVSKKTLGSAVSADGFLFSFHIFNTIHMMRFSILGHGRPFLILRSGFSEALGVQVGIIWSISGIGRQRFGHGAFILVNTYIHEIEAHAYYGTTTILSRTNDSYEAD